MKSLLGVLRIIGLSVVCLFIFAQTLQASESAGDFCIFRFLGESISTLQVSIDGSQFCDAAVGRGIPVTFILTPGKHIVRRRYRGHDVFSTVEITLDCRRTYNAFNGRSRGFRMESESLHPSTTVDDIIFGTRGQIYDFRW